MHAASVYPEPGSNSLNMIYQVLTSVSTSYRVCLLFLLFRALFLNSKEFSESFLFVIVVQFSRSFAFHLLADSFVIISKPFTFVKHFFQSFLSFFEALSLAPATLLFTRLFLRPLPQLSLTALLLYQLLSPLSITFFYFFYLLLFRQAIQYR